VVIGCVPVTLQVRGVVIGGVRYTAILGAIGTLGPRRSLHGHGLGFEGSGEDGWAVPRHVGRDKGDSTCTEF
jgi:hypothetical protein